MKKFLIVLIAPALVLFSCAGNQQKNDEKPAGSKVIPQAEKDLLTKAAALFKVLPTEAVNAENPVTDAKVKLGKILYYDNRLSKDQTQSCNTCHNLSTYGVDNLPTSPGDNGIPGTRNSPTVLNAAFKTAQFWDGRNKDVEEQAGGPILNPAEMAIPNEQFLIDRLKKVEMYQNLFATAYPSETDPFTYKNIRHAIAAFERTLITPSRFDNYLAGNYDALSTREKTGLKAFMDVGCIACHSGSLLGGTMLQKFPLFGKYEDYIPGGNPDYGKFVETKVETDKFMFFVPLLRNVEKTAPYLSDGSIADLAATIRIMGKAELNKDLTDQQVNDMLAFFKTLTGEVADDWQTVPEELK
ncbi:MAG: c-type cytochrome [Bacteroidales bacterium]|nr:c-type cytochrome [Bacteroidales bacterium]